MVNFLSKMYLGGRFVLGSGSCWPHDFLFLTGFFSGAGVPEMLPFIDPPNMLSSSLYDCGVMAWLGSISLKSDGYDVPGVEMKLSARLSTGEFSNLMCGVVILNSVVNCRIGDGGNSGEWMVLLQGMLDTLTRCIHFG